MNTLVAILETLVIIALGVIVIIATLETLAN